MTKEDVIEILERFVIGAKPCSQREIVDACASAYRMLKEQSFLPSNLDETAKKIAYDVCKALPNGEEKDTIVYYAIQAAMAAEGAAEQEAKK